MTGAITKVTASMTHKSKRNIASGIGIGTTRAVIPMMASKLNIHEPSTLPSATPAWPRTAAIVVAANSGNDVPTAISVRPITVSDIPNVRAISDPDTTIR